MTRRVLMLFVTVALAAAWSAPAIAQRTQQPAAAQQAEAPKPITRAQKAKKMFSDATSLWQGGRHEEAAQMFEALVKEYPTSELVPEALSRAVIHYYSAGQEAKAKPLADLLKNKFPNNQYTLAAYWRPVEAKCHRDSTAPLEEQIRLLEVFLDRYWAQANFGDAIERLARCLLRADKIKELDAFLSHVLAESSAEGMGGTINMIQRACGGRKDYENMADIYGEATKNIDAKTMPAAMAVRLLEIRYLILAGSQKEAPPKKGEVPDEAAVKAAEARAKRRANCLVQALKKADEIIRERPKSEHAAYCALVIKPEIIAAQGKPGDAARALTSALEDYGIFALKKHREDLCEYQAAAEDYRAAIATLDRLLGETNWPHKQRGYLETKHGYQLKLGNIDEANKTNQELIRLFPDTLTSLSAELRIVGNLAGAERVGEARTVLLEMMQSHKNDPHVAAAVLGTVTRVAGGLDENEAKSLREQFIELFPASAPADEMRKALSLPLEDAPTAKAKAVYEEYKSFAKESNVDAARRRIDRLFDEFPSSELGAAAACELADALNAAKKPEMMAELNILVCGKCPFLRSAEERLRDAGAAYMGASMPAEAMNARLPLVERFRYSSYWQQSYVDQAAATLDAQNKIDEAQALLDKVADSLGNGPEAADTRAYMARRLETQENWGEAAETMLKLLGNNASNPAYRPLIGEAFRFLVVAGAKDIQYKIREQKLLENLANRYEGWDEADRIRLSLSGSYARAGDGGKAVKLIKEIQGRHQKYELGAHGEPGVRYLSKYSSSLYRGTVGYHPVDRVALDMSGGYGNYLYAHSAEDMIDYALMLTQPQAYVDRMRQELGRLVKTQPNRPRNYKSGIPYKTKNVLRPRWHPWPEQRRVYGMVSRIEDGMRRLQPQQRLDATLWLEVYPLWPHHCMNDERIRAAATTAISRGDKDLTQKALGILRSEYNIMVWEPYILAAEAHYQRYQAGGSSKAVQLYRTIVQKYRDHELAAGAAQAIKDMGGR